MLQIRCRGQHSRLVENTRAPPLQHALPRSGLARRRERHPFSATTDHRPPRERGPDQRHCTCRAAISNGASSSDFNSDQPSQPPHGPFSGIASGVRQQLSGMDGLWGRFLPMVSQSAAPLLDACVRLRMSALVGSWLLRSLIGAL